MSEQEAEQPSEGTENIAPVTFEILPQASSKGEDILSSSDGYAHTKNGASRISLYWICSQSRRNKCLSRAKTTAGVHSRSSPEHNHDTKPSDTPIREIVRDCKESGTSNLFISAGNLVELPICPLLTDFRAKPIGNGLLLNRRNRTKSILNWILISSMDFCAPMFRLKTDV